MPLPKLDENTTPPLPIFAAQQYLKPALAVIFIYGTLVSTIISNHLAFALDTVSQLSNAHYIEIFSHVHNCTKCHECQLILKPRFCTL